jgi:chromosome partitioning protein
MTLPVLTFFNNKGGVGKTSLVYHITWMLAELGVRVLAVDLDPQANLTGAFLSEEELVDVLSPGAGTSTIFRAIQPLLDGEDIRPITPLEIRGDLALLPGDLALSTFEDLLSSSWTEALGDKNQARPFQILTSLWRTAQRSAEDFEAQLIVCDVGPHLDAINRAALLASDFVVVPLGADLLSLRGLLSLGTTLKDWRRGWSRRKEGWNPPDFELPGGGMDPIGYVALRHGVRLTRPVQSDTRWLDQIPTEFRTRVLQQDLERAPALEKDPNNLGMLKNYYSLMQLAQEARKPIFALRAADGAIGAHAMAVNTAYGDFQQLTREIAKRIKLRIP